MLSNVYLCAFYYTCEYWKHCVPILPPVRFHFLNRASSKSLLQGLIRLHANLSIGAALNGFCTFSLTEKKSVFLAYCNYRDYLLKMIYERLRHKAVLHKQKCHISDVLNKLSEFIIVLCLTWLYATRTTTLEHPVVRWRQGRSVKRRGQEILPKNTH